MLNSDAKNRLHGARRGAHGAEGAREIQMLIITYLFQFGLELEVRLAALHRYEELR